MFLPSSGYFGRFIVVLFLSLSLSLSLSLPVQSDCKKKRKKRFVVSCVSIDSSSLISSHLGLVFASSSINFLYYFDVFLIKPRSCCHRLTQLRVAANSGENRTKRSLQEVKEKSFSKSSWWW
ncbi:hypothetical protein Ddye_031469 [Dipteronia dyeriana]|uniref:Secreted protein n=1 Tax=Dipteronia dyeriana TaxID=168575 RepID=A0AAD9WNG7_9ROSI|nr:hypothetical protein Ddye_031469 [Dipteronia dyeriana]